MRKNQNFLYNLREIAFAHPCKIISKFRAIFIRNVRKSFGTIFFGKKWIGNPIHYAKGHILKKFYSFIKDE